MAQIWEYIKIAVMNIKSNKARSILTMLGIIIGISSVIMIISIGNGVRGSVNEELENMYGGKITIYTNSGVEGNDVKFTEDDFKLVKEKVAHVKGVTTQYSYWGATGKARKGNFSANLEGGSMRSATNQSLEAGISHKMSTTQLVWSALSTRAAQDCCTVPQMW